MGFFKVDRKELRQPVGELERMLDRETFDVEEALALFEPVLRQLDNARLVRSGISDALREMEYGERDVEAVVRLLKKANRARKGVWAAHVGLICAVVGLAFFGLGLRNCREARRSASWPSTDGKITSSSLKTRTTTSGKDRRRGEVYSARIEYAYEVGGRRYTGHRLYMAGTGESNNRRKHEKLVASYPKGKRVRVYYDPERPQEAVLHPGVVGRNYWLFYVGALPLLLGVVLLSLFVVWTRRLRPELSPP